MCVGVELKTGWGQGHDPAADLSFVVVAFEASGVVVHPFEPLVGFGLGCFQPFVDQPDFLLGDLDDSTKRSGRSFPSSTLRKIQEK